MLKKALTLKKNNKLQEAVILDNIGKIYYENGNDKSAVHYLQKAVDCYPPYSSARYQLSITLANLGKLSASKEHLNKIILELPDNVISPLNMKGLILIKERKYREALSLFRKCLSIRRYDKNALINLGGIYYLTGDYHKAKIYFKLAYHYHPRETFTLLWLIDVNLRVNDKKEAIRYIDTLLSNVSAKSIRSLPAALSEQNMFSIGFIKPGPSKYLLKEIDRSIEINTNIN
jgi:tetratricopeptide (TPR) repeat protein